MKLSELPHGEQIRLARKVNVHQSHLSKIARGRRRPSPELALRIEQAMSGAVTRDELLFPELYEQEETV